ncbi:MAG: hypothetical protein H6730_08355 [Deltaproteobacteria bacterium]|nr:hypothetical protein [Deltaproteobacteria bacterium]
MRSTQHSRSEVWLALLLFVAPGCALEDGQPWGRAVMSLEAAFAPAADRLDPQGRLITSASYAVALDAPTVTLEAFTLAMAGEAGASGAVFDPANPPEGYSLCHNGHCHADDGALVAYEDIQAELDQASGGGGGFSLTVGVDETPTALTATPATLTLEACPGDCALPRGEVQTVSVGVHQLHLSGRMYDATSQGRLPSEGRAFTAALEIEQAVDVAFSRAVDRGEPVEVQVAARFTLPASLLDRIELGELLTDPSGAVDLSTSTPFLQDILQNLSEAEALEVLP